VADYEVHEVTEGGGILWRSVADPDAAPVELTPGQIQALGLVQTAREAINDRVEAAARPVVVSSQADHERGRGESAQAWWRDERADRPAPTVLGGYTDEWRWQLIDGTWAIDNRPAVDAAKARGDGLPEYQHVAVPDEVLRAILSS
jgi:hypothetical protein